MDSISVPHCNGTVILDNGNIKFLPNEHYFVGIFYICFFIVAVIPQFFLMFTCLLVEKQHISLSCYKLMTIVCFCDMTNLVNCMLMAGIFTLFDIQHCNSGLWIISYGQFVMFFWYAYCIANLILAFNRLFEFLNKEVSTFFFEGNRCWFWLLGIFVYAASLCAFAPNPYYFYNAQAGTNYYHIYNNMIKLGLMIVCYVLMLILLKRKLSAASGSVSDLQKRLSIQACLIASACAAGNITYVVISYMPMGNSPITGTVGEFLWGVQHSAAGFVYIVMNKSVKRNVFRLLCFLGFKAFASKTKLSIATKTVSVAPRSTTVVQHI